MSVFSPESDWSESLTRVIDFLTIIKISINIIITKKLLLMTNRGVHSFCIIIVNIIIIVIIITIIILILGDDQHPSSGRWQQRRRSHPDWRLPQGHLDVMMSIMSMMMISLSTMVFQLFYFEVKLSQLVKPGQCSQFHQPTCFQLEIQVRWTPCLVNGHVQDDNDDDDDDFMMKR